MSVKKVYAELVEFLEANKNKKVETIMPQLYDLCASKQNSKNFIKDDEGNVTHVFCYYHKLWESVDFYGKKSSSPSGYNSMCKEGVNQWTKQQREAKKAESKLLERLASGEISPDQIQTEKENIEAKRKEIIPREDGHGTETI